MGGEIAEVQRLIAEECDAIKSMLLAKNQAYGNSAIQPLRVFSRASADEQIRVRLDDKLSRILRGNGKETEDVEADIIGYLVLLRVQRAMAQGGVLEAGKSEPVNDLALGDVVGIVDGVHRSHRNRDYGNADSGSDSFTVTLIDSGDPSPLTLIVDALSADYAARMSGNRCRFRHAGHEWLFVGREDE